MINMKKASSLLKLSVIGIALLTSFQNCGKATNLQFNDFNPSTAVGQQNISLNVLQTKCASCHTPVAAPGGVGDVTDLDYLLYSRLLVPQEPDLSPIFVEISSGAMPPTGPLSASEIDAMRKWISNLNNQATSGGSLPTTTIQPTFSSLNANVFSPICKTCHVNKTYKFDSYANILKTVTAGNSAASLMYVSITTSNNNGGKMPQGGGLSATQIKAIQDWINAGAQNN